MQFPSKSQWHSSQRLKKSTLKFIWKHKRPWKAKAILSKKNNAGGITIPDFKLYYKAIVIKTAWYWHKNRYEDQWNRIEDPDMNPHSYAHLVFNKGAKNIRWKIDSLFNKCCWEKWLSGCRKLKLDPCLSSCTSTNSKWIKDPNIRPETLKLVQKRARNTLEAIGVGKDFLNRTPATQQLRERIDKWDYMKLKSFCTTKMVSKLKRSPTEWEKILLAIHQTKD
jgi:uncharacterized protein (DUF736 family)